MGALLSKVAWRVAAALAVLVSCVFGCSEGAWAAAPTRAFAVPGDHPYTVPAGVTSITVKAVGAGGGDCTPAHGGRGASITATVPVTPGEALVVGVGGFGGPCGGSSAPGGSGGGGAGGKGTATGKAAAGGGGASIVAPGSSSPQWSQALVVAGGGGGSSQLSGAGSNGGDAGSPGQKGSVPGSGGKAGTQSAGGAGGVAGDAIAQPGFSGSLGAGGAGGHGDLTVSNPAVSTGGGGGGGGYYGGGGGGGSAAYPQNSGGGGGGSSYVIPGGRTLSGPAPTSGGPEVIITPHVGAAPGAKITGANVSSALHTAKFVFRAGQGSGFQCALQKKRHGRWSRASFSSCRSPKLYAHLKAGKYKFEVRSVSAGTRGKPVGKRFTIT